MESPYFFHPFGFETPFLALVVAFYGFYKRYLGIFEILSFLAIFGPLFGQKYRVQNS